MPRDNSTPADHSTDAPGSQSYRASDLAIRQTSELKSEKPKFPTEVLVEVSGCDCFFYLRGIAPCCVRLRITNPNENNSIYVSPGTTILRPIDGEDTGTFVSLVLEGGYDAFCRLFLDIKGEDCINEVLAAQMALAATRPLKAYEQVTAIEGRKVAPGETKEFVGGLKEMLNVFQAKDFVKEKTNWTGKMVKLTVKHIRGDQLNRATASQGSGQVVPVKVLDFPAKWIRVVHSESHCILIDLDTPETETDAESIHL